MQTTGPYWRDEITDLRNQAAAVLVAPVSDGRVSARQAAAILSGICSLVSRRWTVDTMQRACAALARMKPFTFAVLPADVNGVPSDPVQLVAVVARSILPMAGEANLRAALAFWASEEDPAVWQIVTE
jgi:hypothetical protein